MSHHRASLAQVKVGTVRGQRSQYTMSLNDFFKTWATYDTNFSGNIAARELRQLCWDLVHAVNPNAKQRDVDDMVQLLLRVYDTNNDGRISVMELAEFFNIDSAFFTSHNHFVTSNNWRELIMTGCSFGGVPVQTQNVYCRYTVNPNDFFRYWMMYDKSNNGWVSVRDLKVFLLEMFRSVDPRCNDRDVGLFIEELVRCYDARNTGQISLVDLARYCNFSESWFNQYNHFITRGDWRGLFGNFTTTKTVVKTSSHGHSSSHFACWNCDKSLVGYRYILREDHPYCVRCYEDIFANTCEECHTIIGTDSKDLSYKDKHWHERCFSCSSCKVSLCDKPFGAKSDRLYCADCHDEHFASRCDSCSKVFKAGTKKLEWRGHSYHEECFNCFVCRTPIGTKAFVPKDDHPYCTHCYEDRFATRCSRCTKVITSGGVTYRGEPFHRECFSCSECACSLAGQRFTTRDDRPFCADCFGKRFAKKCSDCGQPITGIGGTKFITFEDRHWHNECFVCRRCETSLVGRGFITEGNELLCPDCGRPNW